MLTQFDQDTLGVFGVKEGNARTVRTRHRMLVNERESGRFQSGELCFDIGDGNG